MEKIECPIHKKPLETKVEDGLVIAVCTCDPRSKSHNQRVYQRPATPVREVAKEEDKKGAK